MGALVRALTAVPVGCSSESAMLSDGAGAEGVSPIVSSIAIGATLADALSPGDLAAGASYGAGGESDGAGVWAGAARDGTASPSPLEAQLDRFVSGLPLAACGMAGSTSGGLRVDADDV